MKYLIITCILLIIVGCSSAQFERTSSDGTTTKIDYKYIALRKEFRNLKIDPDTGLIELGSSKSNSDELAKLLNRIMSLAEKGAAAQGIPVP